MNPVVILLICISFVVLALGFYAWKLTSSRSIIFNALLGSFGLLLAAYLIASKIPVNEPKHNATFIIPFFVTMLFLGRGGGLWWRSRKKERELRLVAVLLLLSGVLALVGTIAAFMVPVK
ncbi:MAG: hypothetical protein ABI318_21735 [Chthoniobacteraceae bacterium]